MSRILTSFLAPGRRRISGVAGAVLVAGIVAGLSCKDSFPQAPTTVAQVMITPEGANLVSGDTLRLHAVALDAHFTGIDGKTATWTSGTNSVVSVDGNGLLLALQEGTSLISAEIDGQVDTTTITVIPTPVARVDVSPETVTLVTGLSLQLQALLYDADDDALSGREVAWSSDNSAIAAVSPTSGLVTAGATLGTTFVRATVEGFTDSAQVTVIAVPVKQVVVSPNPAQVNLGLTLQLNYQTRDSIGGVLNGREVTFESLNNSIATVSTGGLVTGQALGTTTIVVRSEGVTTNVPLTVVPRPLIGLSNRSPQFSAQRNGALAGGQVLNITNAGTGTLTGLSIGAPLYGPGAANWLNLALGGTTAPTTLSLQPNTTALDLGTYVARIVVSSSDPVVPPDTVTVTYIVAQGPIIGLSRTTVNPTAQAFAPTPVTELVTITNPGGGTLDGLSTSISASGAGWLTASLSSTAAPSTLTLTANASSLAAGSYSATVTISSTQANVQSQTVTVNFTVTPQPSIALSSTTASFSATRGGTVPGAVTRSVTNTGGGTLSGLSVSVSAGDSWLSASIAPTTAPATVTLQPNTTGLAAGTYPATVTVSSSVPGVQSRTISVTYTVLQPQIGLSGTSFLRSARPASTGATVSNNAVTITNSGDAGSSLSGLSASDNAAWLSTSLNTTTAPATLTISYNTAGLAPGTYTATITVASSLPGVTSRTITVTLDIDWSFFNDIRPLMSTCQGCHQLSNSDATWGADFRVWSQIVNHGTFTDAACDGRTRIVPNNVAASTLYQKLTATPPCGVRMPQGGPYWSSTDLNKLAEWINRGAPNN